MHNLKRALALLTVLPVTVSPRPGDNPGAAMAWYPLVGFLLGVALLAVYAATTGLTGAGPGGRMLAAALTLALWAALTGGLHLDGWGDCCDGLLCALPRERRLEIMKDPQAGSFAVIGLVVLLLVKCAALTAIRTPWVLLLAPLTARWAVVLAAKFWPNARPGGMGDRFRAGVGPLQLAAATLTCGAAVIVAGLAGLLALGGALAALLLVARLAMARLGGLTGDVYGAIIEGAEALALLAVALLLP
ncbi:MAG TPA: adenosylcobinamide-GDP ribazoletransferase [bacterium]|nr:adenosylcobinamide-GDP ribazoletransferase [bacterium]